MIEVAMVSTTEKYTNNIPMALNPSVSSKILVQENQSFDSQRHWMLLVYFSVVDTIATSIIDFYCCVSSHFTFVLYNLSVFPDIYVHKNHCS